MDHVREERLIKMPETHPDGAINDATSEIQAQGSSHEANIYTRKTTKPFWKFVNDACNYVTWIVSIVNALEFLRLWMDSKGIYKVYDYFRIILILILVTLAAGIKSYPKILQLSAFLIGAAIRMTTKWQQQFSPVSKDTERQATTLLGQLKRVDTFVEVVGLTMKVALLVMLLGFYFFGLTDGSNEGVRSETNQTSASDVFYCVVTIVVTAVNGMAVARPKVLPVTFTLFLIYTMKRMIADKALVHRLAYLETMGSATTICTDDTIFHHSPVVRAWVSCGKMETVSDLGTLHKSYCNVLMEAIMYNINVGLMIEDAIIKWGLEAGKNYALMESESVVFHQKPFCSNTNQAGVAIKFKDGGQVHLHWKGDPKIILEDCEMLMDATSGSILAMGKDLQENVSKIVEGMISECSQCIAFGYREIDSSECPVGDEMEEWKIQKGPLVLLAVIGIKNRPEVQAAIQQCQQAGVKVRMITDKHILTAKAIATEYGIIYEGDLVVEGATFRGYSDEMRIQLLPNIVVLANSSSFDKLLMLRTLRQLNEVVVLSGNVSMMPESERNFADNGQGIVIMDDNFSSAVTILQWGPFVYLNIQKCIQFRLTVYLVALIVNFVAAITSDVTPLTSLQLQCVYLIMDIVGAMALASGPPRNALPRIDCKQPLISNMMWKNIFWQALYQATIVLVLQFRGRQIMQRLLLLSSASPEDINTVTKTTIFNAFVFCQFFNQVPVHNVGKNDVFEVLSTTSIFFIFIQFLSRFTSTVQLEWQLWLLSILIGSCSWPIGYLVKFIHIPKETIINTCMRWIRRQTGCKRQGVRKREPKLPRRQVSLCLPRIFSSVNLFSISRNRV